MSTPTKDNNQKLQTRQFVLGGVSCMDLLPQVENNSTAQKKANKIYEKQSQKQKINSLDQENDEQNIEHSDQDEEETTHKVLLNTPEQSFIRKDDSTNKRKRFIQKIDVQSEDDDDEQTFTNKSKQICLQESEDNSREFTFRFFTKDSNNPNKLVHTVQETPSNQFLLYGGEVFNNVKSHSSNKLNIPKKTIEIGQYNSLTIGSDNQIYNLIDKKQLFQKSGDNLYAISEEELKSNLTLDSERNNKLFPVQKKKIICNCIKSKCLKLYCECFQNGEECNDECKCCDCNNNEHHHEELQKARQETIAKNPHAFQSKFKEGNSQLEHFKGCNCKKSGCLKKYCECYNSGVACTKICKCEGCKNGSCETHQPSQDQELPSEQTQQAPGFIQQYSQKQQQKSINFNKKYNVFDQQGYYHTIPPHAHGLPHFGMNHHHMFKQYHHSQKEHHQYYMQKNNAQMYEGRALFCNQNSNNNIIEKIEDKENQSSSNSSETFNRIKQNQQQQFKQINQKNTKSFNNNNKKFNTQSNISQIHQQLLGY